MVTYHAHDDLPPGYITGAELARRSGVAYRQIDYWTRAGHLQTATDRCPGSGFQRAYPTSEVEVAVTIQQLRQFGYPLRRAVVVAREGLLIESVATEPPTPIGAPHYVQWEMPDGDSDRFILVGRTCVEVSS